MKQSILYALFSALITAVFITGAPAFGQTVGETQTYVSLVRTADLDLGTNAGKRLLDQRVARQGGVRGCVGCRHRRQERRPQVS